MENAILLQTELDVFLGNFPYKKSMIFTTSILAGLLMSKTAFEVMRFCSPKLFPETYSKLSDKDRLEWNNRAISFTHAIVSTLVASYLFFLTDLFSVDGGYGPVVFRSTILTQFFLGVSNGYFISDVLMVLRHYPNLGGMEFVAHHALSIISLFLAVHSGCAHIYIYMVLLSEITTPFINIRWYLAAADKKKSKAYIINGVALFLSWLVARILLFAYLFKHMYDHYDQIREINPAAFYFIFVPPPGFALMNLYWFGKIFKGLVKTLKRKEA